MSYERTNQSDSRLGNLGSPAAIQRTACGAYAQRNARLEDDPTYRYRSSSSSSFLLSYCVSYCAYSQIWGSSIG